jgi:hypothetical protein
MKMATSKTLGIKKPTKKKMGRRRRRRKRNQPSQLLLLSLTALDQYPKSLMTKRKTQGTTLKMKTKAWLNNLYRSGKRKLQPVVRSNSRTQKLLPVSMTSVPLFVVFWDTSIPVRRSSWTKLDKQTCRRVKLVVSRSKSVQHTSLWRQSNRRRKL